MFRFGVDGGPAEDDERADMLAGYVALLWIFVGGGGT